MSGGSQHNPNGRQSQLGAGWNPLQLQMANLLARAPQAHMASERGVTWHTPTPPPHLYHVPAPSPPDPLQVGMHHLLMAMKNVGGNSVFRHTATPPELYRHTPTPPDKHLMRHTPSPGDAKAGAALPPADLYPHLGPARDKLRPEELMAAYARGGVDLSLGGPRGANGAAPCPAAAPPPPPPAQPASPALSVRDAPTINSLLARAQPRHPHAKFDAILERLAPSPVSPHSVIMHSRVAPTPSPPSSNEDSADSCGGPPGSKRKRKPERTVRVPAAPPPPAPAPSAAAAAPAPAPPPASRVSPPREPAPVENGDTPHTKRNGPDPEKPPSPRPAEPHVRRKTRSGSAETIDDIAAMIASTSRKEQETGPEVPPKTEAEAEPDREVAIDNLKSVLASPEPPPPEPEPEPEATPAPSPPKAEEKEPDKEKEKQIETPVAEVATAPRRRSARAGNSESTNVPVESPSEAKPAEPEASEGRSAEPAAASFVEVENQLEKMFAGLEEPPASGAGAGAPRPRPDRARKRRKSMSAKGERKKAAKRVKRASTGDEAPRRRAARGGGSRAAGAGGATGGRRAPGGRDAPPRDAYDSGSNASSSRSRGPYIQIRGPRDSPLSVSVVNSCAGAAAAGAGGGAAGGAGGAAAGGAAAGGADEEGESTRRKHDEFARNGLRARGLHASTLGLRYDATTPDATWLCAFCGRGPHAAALGDLFGPYTLHNDCDEYRALDEATRRRYSASSEVWFHAACGVWAPGLVAAGARLWGLPAAVWGARGARCQPCAAAGAALACAVRPCRARAHLPCAAAAGWALDDHEFRALCPRHSQEQ